MTADHRYDPRLGDTWCQHCNSALSEAPHDSEDETWLARLFADEYCAECGGDAQHHTVVPFMGNPFARCDHPSDNDGNRHPIIAAFREKEGTA